MNRQESLRRVSLAWLVSVSVPITLIAVQTVLGKYGEDSDSVWAWIFAQFAICGSLIGAAMFGNPSKRWKESAAPIFHHRLAMAAVIGQGLALLIVFLAEPLVDLDIAELLRRSTTPLTLVQSCAIAALSYLVFDGR